MIHAIYLIVIFGAILLLLNQKKPLSVAIAAGSIVAILLYRISMVNALRLIDKSLLNTDVLELLIALYGINLLQEVMNLHENGQKNANTLEQFNNPRASIMIAPFFIGMLPSPNAVALAAPIVDKAAGQYLSAGEKAFTTSYFRHISESFAPTYAYIILAVSLSRIGMAAFQLAMLPAVAVLFLLGFWFFVRKIPKTHHKVQNTKQIALGLLESYWPILALIFTILLLNIPIHFAIFPVVALFAFANHIHLRQWKPILLKALQPEIMLATALIMYFKEILMSTSMFAEIQQYLTGSSIVTMAILAVLFFVGSLVIGSQAIIAIGVPLAFASFPTGGVGLLVFIISLVFAASQLSPTHICLAIAAESFHVSFGEMIKKAVPVIIMFLIIIALYSYGLSFLF